MADSNKRPTLWSRYVDTVGIVDRSVNYALGEWGAFVANRPVITIVVSSIISLGLMGGLVLIADNVENESDKLWVPQDSIWLQHERYLTERLGRTDRLIQFIFEAKEEGGSVLTTDAIREMFRVHEVMKEVAVESEDGERMLSWENGICIKTALGTCSSSGILRYFQSNASEFERVAAGGEEAVLAALSVDTYPDGGPVNRVSTFIGLKTAADGAVQSATMARSVAVMAPEVTREENADWGNAVEDVFIGEVNGPLTSELQSINLYISTPTSLNNAIGESVGGDIPLIAIAFIVIMTFATLVLFVKDKIHSKISLALMGIATVALSIGASFGLTLILQVPFTSLSQLMPFIILGIGVDDIFVLVRSMEEVTDQDRSASIPQRFRRALNVGGMSITVTSATNFAAFMFGSLTSIPAVKWFCWTAAVAVAVVWVMQLTLFLGYFVLNERRVAANRFDCCCCWSRSDSDVGVDRSTSRERQISVGILSSSKDSYLQQLLNKYVLPALLSTFGKVVVVLLVVALAIVGAIGVTRLDEGLPLGSLAPDGHYFKAFDNRNGMFRKQTGPPANLYFRYVDPSNPAIQAKMLQALNVVRDAEYVSRELSPTSNWLSELQAFVAQNQPSNVTADGSVKQAVFYDQLDLFLAQQPFWKDDVHFEGGNGNIIEVSLMEFVHIADEADDGTYVSNLLTDMLDVQDTINKDIFGAENDAVSQSGEIAMLNGGIYKYGETDRIIFRELLTNLGFALLGIAIISLLTLVHPAAVVLIVLCILLVDLGLFAEMWVFAIRLNTISVVSLVMAVGLAVDYSLHILHTFLHKSGDRTERVRKTMLDIGAAVLLGLVSTLLGVVVLAGSSSQIIRTFFKLLCATVLFAGLVGILFLSVVLTYVGPAPLLQKEGYSEMSEEKRTTAAVESEGGVRGTPA